MVRHYLYSEYRSWFCVCSVRQAETLRSEVCLEPAVWRGTQQMVVLFHCSSAQPVDEENCTHRHTGSVAA